MQNQKRRGSIDPKKVTEILKLIGIYRDSHIARKYGIDRTTVIYYREHHRIKKKVPVLLPIPEIQAVIDQQRRERVQRFKKPRFIGDYESQIKAEEDRKEKRQMNCHHAVWIKRCSLCGAILESDAQVNDHFKHL